MRVVALSSGSSGNAYLVQAGQHTILIDCGKSASQIERFVRASGVNPATIAAIFITHDHSDHIRGAATLSKRFDIPVIANRATLDACNAAWTRIEATEVERYAGLSDTAVSLRARATKRKEAILEEMPTGGVKTIGDLDVCSFPVSHDAAEAVGYTFRANGVQGTLITDTGTDTPQMYDPLINSHIVVIEANHNIGLLNAGRYPYPLKQRILSDHGHLSNVQTAKIMAQVLARRSSVPAVWLIHLSHENNTATHAQGEIQNYLKMAADGLPRAMQGLRLQAALRDRPSLDWKPEHSFVQASLF